MTNLTRRQIGGLGAAAALLGVPAVARAQQRTVLRIGWTSGDGAQDPYAVGAREFKKALEQRVGERVDVQLFPNRALGDERPMLDGISTASVQRSPSSAVTKDSQRPPLAQLSIRAVLAEVRRRKPRYTRPSESTASCGCWM